MRRYGDAIEADLHRYYQIDMLDIWRDRISVRKALVLIDHLPRTSAFRCAYADDDEAVEAWHSTHNDKPPVATVPLDEWSPEVERLTDLVDLVAENTAVLVAVNSEGGRYKPPARSMRPRTALARVLARRDDAAFDDLLAEIEESKAQKG